MKSSLLSNCHMVGLLDQSMAGDSRLVVNVVGRHIPMLSFSIFSVISKWCMEARLCSALILTVSNSRLVFGQPFHVHDDPLNAPIPMLATLHFPEPSM